MIYQCEICGAAFPCAENCAKHEKQCKAHHEGALAITAELNALIGSAAVQKINLGAEVTTTLQPSSDKKEPAEPQTKTEFIELLNVDFMAGKNRIVIHLKPVEPPAEPPKKNTKK